MLKKLQALFPNAISSNISSSSLDSNYHWFKESKDALQSIGILKNEVSAEQFQLLSTLFEVVNPKKHFFTGPAHEWYTFLFEDGHPPALPFNSHFRIVQLYIQQSDHSIHEMDLAIQEYFHDCIAFLWIDEANALIIEEKTNTSYGEEDFESISITLENEFYLKPILYLGKYYGGTEYVKVAFPRERELFTIALGFPLKERVFSFEKILPFIIANSLPEIPFTLIKNEISNFLKEDPELLQTVEVFIECNSNASLAAKQLFVHRNTVQYRLDRFTEKTGLNLKDFHNTLTAYFACQITKLIDE